MIAEPTTPLWAAVKALYDSWPPDSEDNAAELGRVLRGLGDTANHGGDTLRGNAAALHGAWRDEAGDVLADAVATNAGDWAKAGAGADQLAGLAKRYAAELTEVKQTIVATIARNDRLYQQLLASSPAMALQVAAAVADYLRKLVGGEVPAKAGKPGLLDRLRTAAGSAFNTAWTLAYGPGTGGPAGGVGVNVFGVSGGLSAALVRDREGQFHLVNSASLGRGGGTPGVFAGLGRTESTAHAATEMGGASFHAGGTAAGEILGGGVSVDNSASGNTLSGTALVGVGTPGVDAEAGASTSQVIPVTPGNLIHEGTMIGQLAAGNPVPFIMDTLGWGR